MQLGDGPPSGLFDPLPGTSLDLVALAGMATAHYWRDRTALRWLLTQRWQQRDRLPWRRLRLALALTRRGVHVRQPLQGNPLQLLNAGRLAIGPRTALAPGVTLYAGPQGRIAIGGNVVLQRNVTVGAQQLVAIGDDCLIAQGCYITDSDHATRDPRVPIGEQGMRVKGPTIIEDNVWLGANVVVTSGVRIGRRSVVGANTVVTRDVPPGSLVHGASVVVRPPLVLPQPAPSPETGAEHRPASAVSPSSPHPNGAKAGDSAGAVPAGSTDSLGTDALTPGVTP